MVGSFGSVSPREERTGSRNTVRALPTALGTRRIFTAIGHGDGRDEARLGAWFGKALTRIYFTVILIGFICLFVVCLGDLHAV